MRVYSGGVSNLPPPVVIALPDRSAEPARPAFPWLASLAPLVMAGMMWAVTKSPAMLMFAGLSPLIAVAGLLDARRRLRRTAREHDGRRAEQVGEFRQLLSAAHVVECAERRASSRSAAECLAPSARLFTAATVGQVVLRLGTGARPSAVGIGGAQARPTPLEQELAGEAALLMESPVALAVPSVLAVVGPLALARSVARGFVLQIAATLAPEGGVFLGPAGQGSPWEWLETLPHTWPGGASVLIREAPRSSGRPSPASGRGSPTAGHEIFISESLDEVPPECQLCVLVDSGSRAVVHESPRQGFAAGELSAEFVSEHQARLFAVALAAKARSSGLGAAVLPQDVSLADLLTAGPLTGPAPGAGRGLAVPLGSDGRDTVLVDLVGQGPHAVVGGTTGSDKSELLLSWVTGLVCTFSAAEVTVLLVDFKGGAAFDAFTHLEQCVGLITDLDSQQAERALGSLRAEIRYRERLLRDAGARDIAEYRGQQVLPRLVIVVDEFAVMLAEFPALHDLFVDIAARGRSLGMHLILCTQRPVGIIRDTLLANCDLRLSLRVNNPGDSTALLGIPDAARLAPESRGRYFIAVSGQDARLFQVARSTLALLTAARRLGIEVRRPWLAPLPAQLDLDELRREAETDEAETGQGPVEGVVFGRFDRPSEQAQPLVRWRPQIDGPLLVLGAGQSGRSSLLAAVASGLKSVAWIPADRAGAWEGLSRLFEDLVAGRMPACAGTGHPLVVLVDDLDSLLASFEPEYQGEVMRWLAAILRDGARHGVILLAAAQRVAAPLSSLAPLFAQRILLRSVSRQEHLLADGHAADFNPDLGPGEGFWSGSRLKVGRSASSIAALKAATRARATESDNRMPGAQRSSRLLVVSTSPGSYIAERGGSTGTLLDLTDLTIDTPRPTVQDVAGRVDSATLTIVGDPDAWPNHWMLFGALRASFDVLFDGCTIADYRSVSRRRDLPPPTNPGMPRRWLLTSAGVLGRAEPEAARRAKP